MSGGFEYDNNFGGYGGTDPGAGGFSQGGGGGGGGTPSSQNGGKSKGDRDRQTIIPMTVQQLIRASNDQDKGSDSNYKVDGQEIHQLKLVGNILQIEESSTYAVYKIEDGTGVIDCKLWIDADDSEADAEKRGLCRQGSFVRAVGVLREYQGAVSVQLYDMRPVTDHNEVTHHMLEAIYVHLQNTKGPKAGQQQQQQQHQGGQFAAVGGFNALPVNQNLNSAMASDGQGDGGFTAIQTAVVDYFTNNGSEEEGASITDAVKALCMNGYHDTAVRDTVQFLSNEGHLYSTIDDEHFKSTL